jgi:hypothetical protein
LLIVAGDQVPLTPFGEVVANIGATVPEQNAGMAAKLVTTLGVIATFNVCVVEHCPEAGVKV